MFTTINCFSFNYIQEYAQACLLVCCALDIDGYIVGICMHPVFKLSVS